MRPPDLTDKLFVFFMEYKQHNSLDVFSLFNRLFFLNNTELKIFNILFINFLILHCLKKNPVKEREYI